MNELERDPIVGQTKERLKSLGIEAVLFDLDDTLIYTAELFNRFTQEYSESVAALIGIGEDELNAALQEIDSEQYKKLGVNPKRWGSVLEVLAEKFDHGSEEILGNLDILMKIYTTVPRLRAGTEALLAVLKDADIKIGLVTHANVDWTNFKLDSLGLWDYFESVTIVDENHHKKSEDWKRAMDGMEIEPEHCLVVGDSLGGDIRPGDELGARTIWMPSPWSVYRQGEVPGKTEVIGEIFEVLAALDRLR